MKIVITGALGHIGSRVIHELPKYFPGADIILIDNLLAHRYCSLFNLSDHCNFQFIEADVTLVDLNEVVINADIVLHLAAITDAANSFKIRKKVAQVNFSATQRMAKLCLKYNVPLIHLSSTSVYGSQSCVMDENCLKDQLNPQSPYAETKLKEEELLSEYQKRGLKYTICRFGTICGVSQGMRFHTAVNKFCWQAVMGHPLTVWRTAQFQKRPYLTLSDAVGSILHIMKKELYDGTVYNILSQNMTVNDIIDIIRKYIKDVEISFVDAEIMNQLSYEVSNAKFKDTGFRFRGSVEKSIKETVKLLLNAGKRIVCIDQMK
ncbi:nucleoside-diphosphate-sugar epimerase [Candidatus Magnetomorum sp. HK-1]|nr:nucleoside-diphosphate-sugar epimerase [Candidatus Magnetomorum sp. HK-1]